MQFSDIKERHIYNVIFDPVKMCEFNGKHLALVLTKNNDRRTCIVMPLTSESNGNNVNKKHVGIINSLPSSLKSNDTYAVFNQIRTVNASRFISLKEGSNVIESKIDDPVFLNLLDLGMSYMSSELTVNEKYNIYKERYTQASVSKAINLAYDIMRLQSETSVIQTEIERLKTEIRDILNGGIAYSLDQAHKDNGIDKVLDSIIQVH